MLNSNITPAAFALALGVLIAVPGSAAESVAAGHVSIVPSEVKWNDAPAVGPGVQLAVLEGDLKSDGAFTFRLKLPPNTRIAPHTHPLLERVTVLSGVFHLGIGEQFDSAKARAYPAGGVTMIPAGLSMFAFTGEEETIVQIHGAGPWGIHYLDPADDPRKQ